MQEQTDLILIKKAQDGDTVSFRALVERYQSMAYSIAFRFLNDSHDSQDVTQEAFLRIWRNLSKYQPEIKLSTWLYKIVTNLSLDLLKSKYYKQKLKKVSSEFAELQHDSNDPQKQLEHSELLALIHQASLTLTPKQRSVFVLRDLEGFSSSEVEDILSMNAGAIKSNLYLARIKMCELLKNRYSDQNDSRDEL